mgnify:FL=1
MYRDVDAEKLFDNLVYFLEAIGPVCEKYDIKNLNGYSGQFPIGWVLNNADDVKNIHKYATDWIEGTNVSLKVYYYDMGTDTWHEYVPVK